MDSKGEGDGGERPNFLVGEDGLEENEAKDEFLEQNTQNGVQPPHVGYEVNLNEKRRRLRWVFFVSCIHNDRNKSIFCARFVNGF